MRPDRDSKLTNNKQHRTNAYWSSGQDTNTSPFCLTNRPEQWGPWQVPHRQLYHDVACKICYSRSCPYQHECLRLVSPQMVVDAAVDLLAEVNVPIGVSGTRT